MRSSTVIALKGRAALIDKLKRAASENNILLGNGYGEYKADTFRLANFPAITDFEFDFLLNFLKKFDSAY